MANNLMAHNTETIHNVGRRVATWCCLMVAILTRAVPSAGAENVTRKDLQDSLNQLTRVIQELADTETSDRDLADVELFAKAAEWILRHDEFYDDTYFEQTANAIVVGIERARHLQNNQRPWTRRTGSTVCGYRSRVDDSIQPYAVTLPVGFNRRRVWPLHVVLHGRAAKMNEINFIHRYNNKPVSTENEGWIQLDVFGRTNNAYRWSGETDVWEALDDVRRRLPVDDDRIVLRGFSMGGAGAWHLGLHHPSRWCSVGPGAGFVDFYGYQKRSEQLPLYQHETLGIYDSVDYALNAFNVPVCAYGGENDPQLLAGKTMKAAAKQLGVNIELIVGPGMGHRFDPESRKAFLAFHVRHMKEGRKSGEARPQIRFATKTVRFHECDWILVEEQQIPYQLSRIDAKKNAERIDVTTTNVRAFSIGLRIRNRECNVDGQRLTVPDRPEPVIFVNRNGEWQTVDRSRFQLNLALHKRHGLQGPIDDAFTDSFVCIRGTGKPWSPKHQQYADFVLERFTHEFDKWLRGKPTVIDDSEFQSASEFTRKYPQTNLILFGDPGSNWLIAELLPKLPIEWTPDTISARGIDPPATFSTESHAVALIFPNPLNPSTYVVINSGHTFHEKDFQASNAWLFPRMGDVAVVRFERRATSMPRGFTETIEWATNFDSNWTLNKNHAPTNRTDPGIDQSK